MLQMLPSLASLFNKGGSGDSPLSGNVAGALGNALGGNESVDMAPSDMSSRATGTFTQAPKFSAPDRTMNYIVLAGIGLLVLVILKKG